jgi:hypothetical protein
MKKKELDVKTDLNREVVALSGEEIQKLINFFNTNSALSTEYDPCRYLITQTLNPTGITTVLEDIITGNSEDITEYRKH